MTDYAMLATGLVIGGSIGAFAMGMITVGSKADVPVCDDWHSVARLTGERDEWKAKCERVQDNFDRGMKHDHAIIVRLRAENADLRVDIAAKEQRLAEHGLQSSGGIDPTVSA